MIVFSENVLDRVSVDGVDVASPRSVLHVVMLVNQRIDPFDVQDAMEDGIEKVVDDNDDGEEEKREHGEGLENNAESLLPRSSGDDVVHGVETWAACERGHVVQE